jgi:hypothetical protein
MRIGVIRGDVPAPLTIMDVEPVSRYNPPTEPRGQERRIGRPDLTIVGGALAVIPAGLQGTVDISGGANIGAGNHTLRAKIDPLAAFTVVTVANFVYLSGAALVVAVNTAIATAGLNAVVRLDATGKYLVLQSGITGVGSYIEVDGALSTFNVPVGFNIAGDNFTVPTVVATITALFPVGGPLNVSAAKLLTTVGAGATIAQRTAVADTIAPRFIETDVVIKSFQVGMINGFRGATYNPDPSRWPPLPNGAAISVVQDDGITPFVAPLTVITGAVHNAPNGGDITVTGTNLGSAGALNSEVEATVVRVTSADGARSVKLYQAIIESTLSGGTQGKVSATSIVIPASLLATLGVVGSKVRVQYTSLASNLFTVT